MKIIAKANGNILDVSDGEAEALLATGIYEPVEAKAKPKAAKVPKAPKAPAKAPKESTKVAPLTTEDLPPPMKKVK